MTTQNMTMKLSRVIPLRIETLTSTWLKRDYTVMSAAYRAARARALKPMSSCYWCKHWFADGETIAIGNFIEVLGNEVLCQECAGLMTPDEKPTEVEAPEPAPPAEVPTPGAPEPATREDAILLEMRSVQKQMDLLTDREIDRDFRLELAARKLQEVADALRA